jgi:ribosomal 50S subunit-associated protein YjgA (DUF615 family)
VIRLPDFLDSVRSEISPHLDLLAAIEEKSGTDLEGAERELAALIANMIRSANPELSRELAAIRAQLDRIEKQQENEVSGLTDLNTNIAALTAEWTTFLADLTTALGNTDSDAAVEAAAQLVAQQTAAIAAEDAIVNPPSTPPPAS